MVHVQRHSVRTVLFFRHCASGETRTLTSIGHRDLNPARLPISPRSHQSEAVSGILSRVTIHLCPLPDIISRASLVCLGLLRGVADFTTAELYLLSVAEPKRHRLTAVSCLSCSVESRLSSTPSSDAAATYLTRKWSRYGGVPAWCDRWESNPHSPKETRA